MNKLLQAVAAKTYQLCRTYPGGIRAMFAGMRERHGLSESSVYADLNPNNGQSTLRVWELVRVMEATGEHGPLRELANWFGYPATPPPSSFGPRSVWAGRKRRRWSLHWERADRTHSGTLKLSWRSIAVKSRPILLPYQTRWLEDDSRFKIGMFSRQSGKTFVATLEIVLDMIRAEMEGRRTRWLILSRGERQAREAIEEGVGLHLRALDAAFRGLPSGFRLGERTECKAMEVAFRGGSRVTALPANPDTARGFSANLLLDEFAFHRDSKKIWKALFPVVSKNGLKLRIVSTPNGKGNRFYELMTGKEDDDDNVWSRHVVDIYQAVSQGLDRNLELLRKGCGDPDAWAQEYELQWLDESTAWLPFSLITDAEDDEAGNPSHSCGGPCFIGVDIGRRRDLFVIWVLEKVGDVLWTREVIERRGATFAEQDALLDDVFARYNVARCCMDQTGMGEKPLEDAQRRHGASCVEGVLFTAANKLALATLGKAAFEERKIRIPMGVQALRADLHKLRKVSGPTGTPRFVADSDSDGHADRTWACFLAVSASSSPGFEYGYTPAGNARDDFYGMDDDDDARGAW